MNAHPRNLIYRSFLVSLLISFFFSSAASALVMREDGPEPIIVQIKESLRLSQDLDTHLNAFASLRNQHGLQVERWWAGSKFLVLLSFPSNCTEQRALDVIETLQQRPFVEKVVPASAFNLHFRSGDFARSYVANATIPDAARRGLDAARIRRSPPRVYEEGALDRVDHVPNRLIVRWKEELLWASATNGFAQAMDALHHSAGCHVVDEIRYSPTKLSQVLELDVPGSVVSKIRQYIQSGLVEYAQPVFIQKSTAVPDDPWYSSVPRPQWTLPLIWAPQAWDITTGNSSVIIAIADTGANVGPTAPHPEFAPNLWSGQNSGAQHNFVKEAPDPTNVDDDDVPHYHGSACASIVGAHGGFNSFGVTQIGMVGVAWNTSLMILKRTDATEVSDDVATVKAIKYAADNGATAINLSSADYTFYCSSTACKDCSETDWNYEIWGALVYAREHNMVVVSAAGNGAQTQIGGCINNFLDDTDRNMKRAIPGSIPTDNNISVLATTIDDTLASYSSWGKYRTDLAAPGGFTGVGIDIPVLKQTFHTPLIVDDDRNFFSGTSAAAPHVTGAIALVKSLYPWENYLGLRDRVLMGTDFKASLNNKCRTNGRLNLYKALQTRSMFRNLSTRALVGGGERIMIGGFIIGGYPSPSPGPTAPPLKVCIRGLGPSVPGLPSSALLGNPKIELHNSQGILIDQNSAWQSDISATELQNLGLNPPDVSEAAMIRTLLPGAYTVQLSDESTPTHDGIGLFEIYELENNSNERSRLMNLSTRCYVGTGDNVAIAGTIIGNQGTSPFPKPDRRVLIFGKGPSLASVGKGAPTHLSDPAIVLHDSSGLTPDQSNDSWQTIDDDSTGLTEELDEASLSPIDARESALWPTFRPGSYTVQLSGVNGSTGIGLIEFYEY